jgi:lipopolysaccharide transport system ATP-binding protein
MQPAIRVDNLSKEYRIGAAPGAAYRTLRESVAEAFAGAWRRLRRLAALGAARGGASAPGEETHWALKDVSFEVPPGAIVGVVGRNGAGKSTLLKVLSRITEPTEGRVEMRGRVGSLLEVGTGFHPELTGRENIYLNGAILGMSRRDITRQFDDIVAFAEIDRFLDTPVKRYSSGMYVRLAFAVAAHIMPETLLVDEVLAVGDAAFQKKCLGKMSEVAHQGRTILFVSHNVAAVEALCKTGILLDRGRLALAGPIGDVLSAYMRGMRDSTQGLGAGDRPGADFAFTSVELLRNGSEPTEMVQTGDPVTVRADMEVRRPQAGIYLGVAVLDDWGRLLCAFHAKEAGLILDEQLSGPLRLEVEIPQLLLLPGLYHLRLVAVARGGAIVEGYVLQEVPAALSFQVLPRDFSGNGHCFSQQQHGTCLMPFRMRAVGPGRRWETEVLCGNRKD